MKTGAAAHYVLDDSFGEPSHVLALGAGRAAVVSRFRRKLLLIGGGGARQFDLAAFAGAPADGIADFGWRGAPFRWGDGFALAYRDRLHLWPTFDSEPTTLATTIPDALRRRERGRLEPLLACAAGERAAIVALHAGAAGVHAAHRLVRIDWDEREARWDARDLYVDAGALGDDAAAPSATDPHPPAIQSMRPDDGAIVLHTTGYSRNHMRYGMACSALVWLDDPERAGRVERIADGYGQFCGDRLLLRLLHSKKGGIDFTILGQAGEPLDTLRITHRAMAPVEDSWLVHDLCGDELWLADNDGRVVRLALS
jgi:hypothetical protein